MADRAFTLVDNAVFDALLFSELHHRQKTVCFAILRLTQGFGREALRAFSIDLLARYSGVAPRQLRELLAELLELGVVVRRDGGHGRRAAWGIAPDPSTWAVATPAPGEQGLGAAPEQQGFDLTPAPGEQGTPAPGEQPGKENSGKERNTKNDGAAAVVVCEFASLSDPDLIAAAQPAFAAYGKQVERWGAGRRRKLRDRADELVRSGLSRDRVLALIAAAAHGFLWFHRDAKASAFDPWKLFTPDTVYGEGFDRYLEAYGEARREGKTNPFTTSHAKPIAPVSRNRPAAAAAPAERVATALERAQVAAVTALRHRLGDFPTPAQIVDEHARVAAEFTSRQEGAA